MSNEDKILIAEDDINASASLCEFFDSFGIVCRTIRSAEAYDKLEKERYSAAVIDINLSGVQNGFALLKRIKAEHPETVTVVITAKDIQDNKALSLSLGADAFLGKPIDLAELANVLRLSRRSSQV